MPKKRLHTTLPKETQAEILRLRAAGLSIAGIHLETGISNTTILHVVRIGHVTEPLPEGYGKPPAFFPREGDGQIAKRIAEVQAGWTEEDRLKRWKRAHGTAQHVETKEYHYSSRTATFEAR